MDSGFSSKLLPPPDFLPLKITSPPRPGVQAPRLGDILGFPFTVGLKSSLLANPIDSKTCPCRTPATPHYQQPGVSHQYTSDLPHCSLSSLVASYSSFCTQQPKWSFKLVNLVLSLLTYTPVASQTLHLQTEFQGLWIPRRWSFSPVSSCLSPPLFINPHLLPVGSQGFCIC